MRLLLVFFLPSLAVGFTISSPCQQLHYSPKSSFFAEESSSTESPIMPSQQLEKASNIRFWDALKIVVSGGMNKRDFLKSRYYRIAKKVNPSTNCGSEEECLIELQGSDPTPVALALEEDFGKNWWQRPFTKKLFSSA